MSKHRRHSHSAPARTSRPAPKPAKSPSQAPVASSSALLSALHGADGYTAPTSFLGAASNLLSEGTFVRTNLSRNQELLTAAYWESWLAKKIIDMRAEDIQLPRYWNLYQSRVKTFLINPENAVVFPSFQQQNSSVPRKAGKNIRFLHAFHIFYYQFCHLLFSCVLRYNNLN